MNRELLNSFDSYFEMFATKGWQLVQEDIEVAIASNAIAMETASDMRTLGHLQGQTQKLRQLKVLERVTREQYDQLMEEKEDESFA